MTPWSGSSETILTVVVGGGGSAAVLVVAGSSPPELQPASASALSTAAEPIRTLIRLPALS